MKIGKRFLIKLSLTFMLVGAIVSFIGFASSGFDIDQYAENQHHWYRVVHFE
ncbi:hypothetical protein [Marinilactibacillus kalidii]|uniref:hypothetical protein n=1 Tax=Marinilactibacillus kalidii TaxID=2820274 RepID=UPI001ABDE600|nr:hypothetical protein [Marinilactibacillus kalidii]